MDSPFISKAAYTERLQIKPNVINGWVHRKWTEGKQYIVVGKTTLVNVEEADAWLEQLGRQALDRAEPASGSKSGGMGGSTTPKQSRAIHTKRLISPARLNVVRG